MHLERASLGLSVTSLAGICWRSGAFPFAGNLPHPRPVFGASGLADDCLVHEDVRQNGAEGVLCITAGGNAGLKGAS